MAVSHAKMLDAQATFSRYASKLRLVQQIAMAWTVLLSIAVAILSFMVRDEDDVWWYSMRILAVAAAANVLVLTVSRITKIAADCDKMAFLLRMHTSGIVTDEGNLAKIEETIHRTLASVNVFGFPIPSVTEGLDDAHNPSDVDPPRVVRSSDLVAVL